MSKRPWNRGDHPRRTGRLAVPVLVLVLCLVAALSGVVGPAAAGPEPDGTPDSVRLDHGVALAKAKRDLARFQQKRRAPRAKRERRRSRTAFASLTGSRAIALGGTTFPDALAAPVSSGLRLGRGEEVDRYLGDFAARIDRPGSQADAIVESTAPLRVLDDSGHKAPLDLGLVDRGGYLESDNPAVDVRYSEDPDIGVKLEKAGVSLRLAGTATSASGHQRDDRLVVPDALTDTDYWVTPTPAGFQTFALLRSAASPEKLNFALDLPTGAELREGPHGTAEVVRNGRATVSISAPIAGDADGVPIPIEMTVGRSRLTLTVDHRGEDLHYPLLLDPAYTEDSWLWEPDETPNAEGWTTATSQSGLFDAAALYLSNRWDGGLYTFTKENVYVPSGHYTEWRLDPPGTTTKVYEATLEVSTNGLNGCYVVGISSGGKTTGCGSMDFATFEHCDISNCDPNAGTAGNYALYRISSNTSETRTSANKLIGSLSSASVAYSDSDLPSFSAVNSGGTTGWSKSYSGKVEGLINDTGIGLRYVLAEVDGVGPVAFRSSGCPGGAEEPDCWGEQGWLGCQGTIRNPCAPSIDTDLLVEGAGIPDGKHKVTLLAEDGLEQQNSTTWGSLWLDREGPVQALSGTLWDESDQIDAAGYPQSTMKLLKKGTYKLKVATADGVSGGSEAEQRSGSKSIEIKVDGETVLAADSISCPAGSCAHSREWTFDTSEFPQGQRAVTVIAKDQIGNQSVRTFHVEVPASGELESPLGGTKTSRWLRLKAHADSTEYTTVRFQVKKAGTSWSNIPLEALSDSAGQPLSSIELPLTSSYSPMINLEVVKAFSPALGGGTHELQVRAMFSGSVGSGSSKPVRVTLEPRGIGTDDARTGIGPGEVNLATGNFNFAATDASVASWATSVALSRSFNSRAPGENPKGPFGPGWTLSAPVEGASDYASLEEVADAYGGTYVKVKQSAGELIYFYLESDKYVSEPGYETMSLEFASGEFKLKDDDGTTVTFRKPAGTSGNLYMPESVQQPGSENQSSIQYQVTEGTPRVTTIVAPVPSGVSCTNLSTAGCRSLKLVYAASTTATGTGEAQWGSYKDRVEKVEFTAYDPSTAAMKTDTVSQYLYDSNGRLRAQWDPRISPALKTTYNYDAGGRLASVSPPAENAWSIAYAELPGDGDGGRLKSVSRVTPQGTATTTVVYGVPISGESAPHQMAPSNVDDWAQTDVPVGATAVFPPDDVPSAPPADYVRATIHYLDHGGREVNTAASGSGISTSEYDIYGNAVRELSAANRQRALDAGSESAATAQKLDVQRVYDPQSKGTEMTEELGPEHSVKLASGEPVRARRQTIVAYDEGAPSEKDPHLPTTTTVRAKVTGAGYADSRITKTEYDWTLLKPTVTIKDYYGLKLTESTTYNSSNGLPSLTYNPRFPKPSSGYGSPERVKLYYSATEKSAVECNNKPQLANLLCRESSSVGGSDVPVTVYTYNRQNQVTKRIETLDDYRERSSVTGYDSAGRMLTSQVKTSSDSDGLMAAYGFEESSGTTTADKSGNGNTGWLKGVGLKRVDYGRYGRALDFTPGTTNVAVSDSNSLDPAGELTMEAWVRPDVGGTSQKVIEKVGSAGCATPAYALFASVSSTEPAPRATSCATSVTAASSAKLPVGVWSHLTVTIDAGNKARFYRNGQEFASKTISALPAASTGNLLIGSSFDGLIDEVRLYNRALSPSEISSDMKTAVDGEATPPSFSQRSGLEVAYGFEELGSSDVVVDSSPNGYDGVLGTGDRTPGGRSGQGADSTVHANYGTPLDVSGGMTLEAWITPDEVLQAGTPLIELGESFKLRSTYKAGVYFKAGDGEWESFNETELLSPGKAHFVAATFNGSSFKVYVDGVQWVSGTSTPGSAKDADDLDVWLLDGMTDEVRVYNKALSLAEIQEDGLMPVAATQSVEGNGTKLPQISYGYSSSTGRPTTTSVTEGGTTRTLTTGYDTVGRVTSYQDADGSTSTTSYDIDGRPVEVTDGIGTQSFGYHSETGQLVLLTDSQAGVFTAEYGPTGELLAQTYPNGMKAQTTYNEIGEPTQLKYAEPGCVKCTYWYQQTVTESIHGQWVGNATTVASHSYSYDGVGRLVSAQETPAGKGCTTRAYTFDANSNRLTKTTRAPNEAGSCVTSGPGTVQESTYSSSDRIVGEGFVYDPWGRLLRIPSSHSGGGDLSMTYYTNDITRTSTQDGKTVGWLLDPTQTRQRATIASGGKQTIYHYSDSSDSPAWTADYNGATLTGWQRNVGEISGGLGALVSYDPESEETEVELQLTNLHGDVVGTAGTDPEATGPTSLFEADEFGNPVGEAGKGEEYSWLGGKERRTTMDSGLVQMGLRSYVPDMGRFTSVDPVYGGSANSYDYANQEPLNVFDLNGQAARRAPRCKVSTVDDSRAVAGPTAIAVTTFTVMATLGCNSGRLRGGRVRVAITGGHIGSFVGGGMFGPNASGRSQRVAVTSSSALTQGCGVFVGAVNYIVNASWMEKGRRVRERISANAQVQTTVLCG